MGRIWESNRPSIDCCSVRDGELTAAIETTGAVGAEVDGVGAGADFGVSSAEAIAIGGRNGVYGRFHKWMMPPAMTPSVTTMPSGINLSVNFDDMGVLMGITAGN